MKNQNPIIFQSETPNDPSSVLVKWYISNYEWVKEGELVCQVETTKALIDIDSKQDGYLYQLIKEDEEVSESNILALVFEDLEELKAYEKKLNNKSSADDYIISEKAKDLISKHKVDISQFSKGSLIKAEDVQKILKHNLNSNFPNAIKDSILIFGIGSQASVVYDLLSISDEYDFSTTISSPTVTSPKLSFLAM